MKDFCAGCEKPFRNHLEWYMAQGNFCRQCVWEINVRTELRVLEGSSAIEGKIEKTCKDWNLLFLFTKAHENRYGSRCQKHAFENLLIRYNKTKPAVSWEFAQSITF